MEFCTDIHSRKHSYFHNSKENTSVAPGYT